VSLVAFPPQRPESPGDPRRQRRRAQSYDQRPLQALVVNSVSAPAGWPCEAGYWVGMRIAQAYVARASDKRAALRELLALRDPAAILKASGYAG